MPGTQISHGPGKAKTRGGAKDSRRCRRPAAAAKAPPESAADACGAAPASAVPRTASNVRRMPRGLHVAPSIAIPHRSPGLAVPAACDAALFAPAHAVAMRGACVVSPCLGGGGREARGCAAWRMPPAVRLGRRRRAIMPKLWREPGPVAGRTRLGGGGGGDGCLGAKACGNARPCAQGAVQSRLARRTPLPTLRRPPHLRPVPDRRRALFRGLPGPPPNARRQIRRKMPVQVPLRGRRQLPGVQGDARRSPRRALLPALRARLAATAGNAPLPLCGKRLEVGKLGPERLDLHKRLQIGHLPL